MHSFSMVHSRARLRIALTAQRSAHFTWVGVALTNTTDSSIAHTLWKKRNKLKRRWERGREARQNESEIQKSKVGGKNNLKL